MDMIKKIMVYFCEFRNNFWNNYENIFFYIFLMKTKI